MANERLIDGSVTPTDESSVGVIGQPLAGAWNDLRRFVAETYEVEPFWQYGGKRYGWNQQFRKGGRPLCEIYPECGSFTAMIVLGAKEMEQALAQMDSFGATVRQYLENSPRYHDGCWMYMRFTDPATVEKDVQDFEKLIRFKRKPPKKKAAAE